MIILLLLYHVARVHDFVLDYLPPHVKEKVVGLERHKARPEEDDEEEEEKEEGTKTTKEVAVSYLPGGFSHHLRG